MPLCYAGGQWLRLTRSEMLDYDIDPDEGKERDDFPPCEVCWRIPCDCGDEADE